MTIVIRMKVNQIEQMATGCYIFRVNKLTNTDTDRVPAVLHSHSWPYQLTLYSLQKQNLRGPEFETA